MLDTLAMLGWEPLLVVLVIVLLLFGPKRIPELMRGVGQSVGELQKGLEDGKKQLSTSLQKDDSAVAREEAAKTESTPKPPDAVTHS